MPVRLRITCIVAIFASTSFTMLALCAGIAAACSGEPPPACEAPKVTTEAATLVGTRAAKLNGKVNANGCVTFYQFQYGTTTFYGSTIGSGIAEGSGDLSVSATPSSLQPKTVYHFRIVATNSEGTTVEGLDKNFTTLSEPEPTTEEATSVTASSATLNGSVNPNGVSTTYEFEYGKTTSYGTTSGSGSAGSGSSKVKVTGIPVSGLEPATTYHFRMVAKNANATVKGGDKSFTTLAAGGKPTATTEAATGVTSTAATLNGSVNPNGLSTNYEFEYGTTTSYGSTTKAGSAGSGTSNVKVNTAVSELLPETTYHFRVVATNSKGTTQGSDKTLTTSASSATWKIKETPNPGGASDSNLYDVSCNPTTKACTSVGKSTASGVDSPLAQRWNGTSWSEQTAAKKSGSTHNRLLGVDCPSEIRCIAVGNYQNSEGGPVTLGEIWNEGKWNVQTTPVPSEATSSELTGVGCNSTANCRASGSAIIKGVKTAIVEKWVSPTWSLESIPIPEGATSSQLDGIDCIWSNFCAAVGRYTTSGGSVKSLVLFWDGEWSLHSVADPEKAAESTLLDVSCTPTPNRCTAVGGWKNSAKEQFTLAFRFNGVTTWTLQSTPNPPGGVESLLRDVSCASETSCAAAGSWVGGSGTNRTLAEDWNGTSWSVEESQDPAGSTFSAFLGVSCRESSCYGAGWSTDGSGVDTTLAEFRE